MTANPHPGKTALTELVEGLEGVTEGPWEVFDGCSWRRIGRAASPQNPREDDCAVLAPTKASDGHPDLTCSRGNDRERNLAHLARCSPDRIKAIAEYVGELEGMLEARGLLIAGMFMADYEDISDDQS